MSTKIIKSIECPLENIPKGKVLFKEQDKGECFFIVKEGSVGIFKDYQKPSQLQLFTIEAGQVLGEIAAIDGLPRSATAVALTAVQVVKVDGSTLLHQLHNSPSWFRTVILDLVERLRKTSELLKKSGIQNSNDVSSLKATDSPD